MKPTIEWHGGVDGHLALLDQTQLPQREVVIDVATLQPLVTAIRNLMVRGAPAIGVAAGYGMVLGVRERAPERGEEFAVAVRQVADILRASRPTAVNLGWAVDRVRRRAESSPSLATMLEEAIAIHREDVELCRAMGAAGADLIRDGATVLTHCNAGRLATAGDGTALAVIFEAHRRGRRFQVIADETRPLLQGSRLTALELAREGIAVEVIVDGAAAGLIAGGQVDLIITGADRVAANGDVANKVGTYGLSLAARAHDVPMYVAAPVSTFDLSLANGGAIPIEQRDAVEVLELGGRRLAAPGIGARNPAFDITPAENLTGLITDRGVISPVTAEAIKNRIG